MSLNIKINKLNDYPLEDEYHNFRLKSFNISNVSDPLKWAKAGFFFHPTSKMLECRYCLSVVSNPNCAKFMEDDHCAIAEHAKQNIQCKFLSPFIQKMAHPNMVRSDRRTKSFKKTNGLWIFPDLWLRTEMAETGVFSKKLPNDNRYQLQCFHCNLFFGIVDEDFSRDLPEEEKLTHRNLAIRFHVKHSPTCGHLIKTIGIDAVEDFQSDIAWEEAHSSQSDEGDDHEEPNENGEMEIEDIDENSMLVEDDDENSVWLLGPKEKEYISKHIDETYLGMADADGELEDKQIMSMTSENWSQYMNRIRCKICLTNEANTLFLPCRHLAACTSCNKSVGGRCIICRETIIKRVNIFM